MDNRRIIDRFDEYMKYKHLTDNKVSVLIGLSNGVIGKSRMARAVSIDTRQVMGILSSISAKIAKKTALPHRHDEEGRL